MSKKIMVIDDEPDTLELAKAILEMNNFEVLTFDVAQQALDSLNNGSNPDLILLDMRMPTISGPVFCKKVRETPNLRNLKIVFFTASSNKDDNLLESTGVKGYIFKPFDNEQLVKDVNNYLSN